MKKYWNDLNVLVDRLWLLLQLHAAGNGNNAPKIIPIINEIRDAGIIE